MPILELTLVRLKPGISPIDEALLHNLRTIRSRLKTNSRFFIETTDKPINLLILGLWPTLDDHHDFLNSTEKNEILGLQEEQTTFQWSVHLGDVESMDQLHLDLGYLVLRKFVTSDDPATAEMVDALARGPVTSSREPEVWTWKERIDVEGSGLREFWLLQAGDEEMEDGRGGKLTELEEQCLMPVEVWRLRDLEKMDGVTAEA